MNFYTLVDQFPDTRPVPEVSGAAVDLVNHDAVSLAPAQELQHLGENRTAAFGRGLTLFKPVGYFQRFPSAVSDDGVPLFLKRYTPLALLHRGNAHVREHFAHV